MAESAGRWPKGSPGQAVIVNVNMLFRVVVSAMVLRPQSGTVRSVKENLVDDKNAAVETRGPCDR